MAKNRVIGAGNALPWHLPADLKRFKALTMGHHIIMGRKTFESIGRPLPGRASIVVTRDPRYRAEGATTAGSLEAALRIAATDDEAFVIGGEQVFREALDVADRIYLTEIDKAFDGDVRFPAFDTAEWRLVARDAGRDEAQALGYEYKVLDRIEAPRTR